MPRHIAIVEDEAAIRANYTAAFERFGYAVSSYESRGDALKAFDTALPDLVVIDISLKDESEGGFDLCREVRSRSSSVPIIFLTARDSELDVISGLRLGADDYLTKDVSIAQITARVAALFRRHDALSSPTAPARCLERGNLELDLDRLIATWRGDDIPLSLTEFWVVYALAKRAGHLKSRDQLMEAANTVIDPATITSHIRRIRRKFTEHDADFDAIQTVYGMGYRWIS